MTAIEASLGAAATLVETHVSTVLLLGERVYKLKKPVRLGPVDFSTREARAAACRNEVALNRRLAPDVYLGVLDLVDAAGAPLDHVVVMRRLPADQQLSRLVRTGADVAEPLRSVARLIADFHGTADRSAAISGAGLPGRVRRLWNENLGQLARFLGSVLDAVSYDEVALRAHRYVDAHERLLERRVADGHVVDGHGDLQADDIFCLRDGPRVLDCIEFSDAYRHGDVLLDVAFLAMDLERLGRPDLAKQFVDWYAERAGDEPPSCLVDHYIAYRAVIRARVACARHAGGDPQAAQQATRLLELAVGRLRAAERSCDR